MRGVVRVLPWTLAILAGCVTPERAPRIEPGPTPPVRVDVPKIPDVPPPDLSALAGRRIVVDPGHGGPWPGAVAPYNGLRESDVNLRVSLHLARLIDGAEGQAVLTRRADVAVDPSSAAADLSARAAIANREAADAFISVHHNADIAAGSDRNALEVYYKLGEDGASLDLGQALTYDLARRLRPEAEAKLLLPGNYKVLREARVPAVLLESSYLTHAGNAAFLATEPAVEAEALAIAAGLAEYFRTDPPKLVSVRLVDADSAAPRVVAHFSSSTALDPGSVAVFRAGAPLQGRAEIAPGTLHWVFAEPLPNGTQALEARVRNVRGAALTFPIEGRVSRAPARLLVTQRPESVPSGSEAEVLFEVRPVDALGHPAGEGGQVVWREGGASVPVRDGVARFYARAGALPSSVSFALGDATATAPVGVGGPAFRSIRVSGQGGGPLADAYLLSDGTPVAVTTAEGWAAAPADGSSLTVARDGYEPVAVPGSAASAHVTLAPRFNGALHGKRVVIDPSYGGRAAGAIGPRGTRASDVNLDVARRAARCLRKAGAVVTLTREDDTDYTELQRVRRAEEAGVELYVALSFGAPGTVNRALDAGGHLREDLGAFIGHYPGSANGIRLANALAARLGVGNVTPSVAYVVQQVSAPAVLVQPASVAVQEAEERYRTVEGRRQAAEAVCAAVVDFYSGK